MWLRFKVTLPDKNIPWNFKMANNTIMRFAYKAARAAHNSGFSNNHIYRSCVSLLKQALIFKSPNLSRQFVKLDFHNQKLFVPYQLFYDYCHKDFEPTTRRLIETSIQPGMTFVDVGANIGYYSVFAGQLSGDKGKIFAIEPAPDNLEFLRQNITLNHLTNVEIFPCAVGNKLTTRTFFYARLVLYIVSMQNAMRYQFSRSKSSK
ncbi:MAG: FkbM family methyltransferase [Caldilinea sp. CFX5]|nr:FkbM family methyltransferase [Caldilinea sp. CFX5]